MLLLIIQSTNLDASACRLVMNFIRYYKEAISQSQKNEIYIF